MTTQETPQEKRLVDPQGREIQKVTVPVVKYKEFSFAFDCIRDEERVKVNAQNGTIRPSEVVLEMRALQRELNHRFTVLAAALASATKGPEELNAFLKAIGLEVIDTKGARFFPEGDKKTKE